MRYATVDDVEVILPPEEELPEDTDRLESMLDEATDLVIGFLEQGDNAYASVEDIPPAITRVVARVAMRNFIDEPANPGAESEVNLMGPFSHTLNWSKEVQARDLFLTDAEKLRISRFKIGYSGSVTHLPMAGACGTAWYEPQY